MSEPSMNALLWRLATLWADAAERFTVHADKCLCHKTAAQWLALSRAATFRSAALARRAEKCDD